MSESQLYQYLKKWFPDLKLSGNQFSSFDCYSVFFEVIIELKCRRTHYDDLILERKKYDSLIKHKDKANIFYVNSTPKGIYLFNLEEVQPEWKIRKLPKQTDFKQTHDIDKEYTLLRIKDAVCLRD